MLQNTFAKKPIHLKMDKAEGLLQWIKKKVGGSGSSKMIKVRSTQGGVSFFLDSGCYQPNSMPPQMVTELCSVSMKRLYVW